MIYDSLPIPSPENIEPSGRSIGPFRFGDNSMFSKHKYNHWLIEFEFQPVFPLKTESFEKIYMKILLYKINNYRY